MTIKLAVKTWLESVEANHFDEWTKERMITETPHTSFAGYLPDVLAFLQGKIVDLGFKNLGLSSADQRKILLAFGGNGVCIPGTQLRMRFVNHFAEVEPMDGTETATLPTWWKEGVLVLDDQFVPSWVGKRVRPDQKSGFNLQAYKDVGDGWTPP
jgi:hypothetical protein